MKEIEQIINIGKYDVHLKGVDNGESYIVSIFFKNYYIPPSYAYNYRDFNNFTYSQESGFFYGSLNEVISDFINIIKTDSMVENKIKIINDNLTN